MSLYTATHPSWIEINLDHIAHNTRLLKTCVGPRVTLTAVVKANAYGHGAAEVARTALAHGATHLAVAYLNEAIALRNAGIDAPCLVMGFTPPEGVPLALQHRLILSVPSLELARAYAEMAEQHGQALPVHIKVDTGMSRLGLLHTNAIEIVRLIAGMPQLHIEGLFTHFSTADDDANYTELQTERFRQVTSALEGHLPHLKYIHAANSAATIAHPAAHFNMVRCGVALYGLLPMSNPTALALAPALSWKAHLALVKTLPSGTPVSYGNTWYTERPSRIAVLPVGYADGLRRAPKHYAEVLVRGQYAPIVGRVCMDQCMLDVTDIPGVQAGDEVVLIGPQTGPQGENSITVEQIAAQLGTINYEVTAALLTRVPRIYIRENK